MEMNVLMEMKGVFYPLNDKSIFYVDRNIHITRQK